MKKITDTYPLVVSKVKPYKRDLEFMCIDDDFCIVKIRTGFVVLRKCLNEEDEYLAMWTGAGKDLLKSINEGEIVKC